MLRGGARMPGSTRLRLLLVLLLPLAAQAARITASGSGAARPSSLRHRSALLALRGGAEEGTLPDPVAETAAEDDTLPAEAPIHGSGAVPAEMTCWSGLQKVWQLLMSLLSPSYSYAKKDTDILGDSSKMCGFAQDDESWRTQRKKLNEVELQAGSRKRVLKDLRIMKRDGPEIGIEVEDCECLTDWVVKVIGAAGTVYEGETYRLRVRFHEDYPSQPPTVTFMRPAPVHEHIYSDGKICLNILYNDWKPEQDVKSVSLALLSMLSSAKKKSRPPDNDSTVVMSQGQKTRNMQWEFHDDHC